MKKWGTALFLLYVIAYLLPLGVRPLGIPDEMRYGEIPREMLASGEVISPRLDGLRYFEKPALGYWADEESISWFGKDAFAVRLPSALAVAAAALGLLLMLRREVGIREGLLAAFIFLCSGLVYFVGTFAVLDSLFAGFITLALCSFFSAVQRAGRQQSVWLVLAGVFVGAAFLTKGFIACAIPVLIIGPYLLWEGRWRDLFRLPWLPLAGALVVALPWCIAIAKKEPDFWNYFFWQEHINRFFAKGNAQHPQPFWFFLPVLIGGLLPWSALAPRPLKEAWACRSKDSLFRFSVAWAVMPFLFFSASSGKLGTYILPCFPPLAILLALGLIDLKERDEKGYARTVNIAIAVFSIPVLLLALAAPVVLIGFADLVRPYDAHMLLRVGGGGVLALSVLVLLTRAWRGKGWGKTVFLGLGTMLLFAGTQGIAPMGITSDTGIGPYIASKAKWIDGDTVLVGDIKTVSSLCFLYDRADVYVFRDQGELDYGLQYPAAEYRLLDLKGFDALRQSSGKRVVVALGSGSADALRHRLPAPNIAENWNNLWFAVYEPTALESTALKAPGDPEDVPVP